MNSTESPNTKLRSKTITRRKKTVLLDYYSNMEDYYSDVEESKRVNCKKSHASARVAVVAVTASDDGANCRDAKSNDSAGAAGVGAQRRLRVKDRSGAWWDCNKPEFPEQEFIKAFRMGKATFESICEELNSVIAKEDTTLRNAIPVLGFRVQWDLGWEDER
ncbi:hypothetical protein RIF29_24750 [Crotalaria pallida]|uniref:Uncharacterized protein n=1 Tax=Crotalaria pallida TaxID=3830 RepID=A0AAN9I3J6_CROPI